MKPIKFSSKVEKKLKVIQLKDKNLFNKIQKQLDLFLENPQHKSLRLHKLKKGNQNIWSISIDRGYRMLYLEDKRIYFFDIGTHDEVYKK